jgi:hypothetical protein
MALYDGWVDTDEKQHEIYGSDRDYNYNDDQGDRCSFRDE